MAVLAFPRTEAVAQVRPAVPASDTAYRLHVYEDLVEVPTLVLTAQYGQMPGLQANSFQIRLDAGRPFQPAAERLEGDDPLDVGVLVDASGAVPDAVVTDFAAALPQLTPGWLGSRDHVSVYAVDCGLFQGAPAVAQASAETLANALRSALANPALHRTASSEATGCRGSRHLWDAIGTVAEHLGAAHGRRVLLVLTDGNDSGSTHTWEQVREYVNGLSVAVFAIRQRPAPTMGKPVSTSAEEPLYLLCAGSGGVRLAIGPQGLLRSMQAAINMVRSRYVLYFPRPANDTAGRHRIDVTVMDKTAIVRPTGVTFPPPDARQRSDPSTVPNAPGRAPELGARRVLQPGTPH